MSYKNRSGNKRTKQIIIMKSDKHTGKAKLSLDQVILAVSELKGVSGRELAKKWNVSHATVNNARAGRSWASKLRLLGFAPKVKTDDTK